MNRIALLLCAATLLTTGLSLLAEPASAAECHWEEGVFYCNTNTVYVCAAGRCIFAVSGQHVAIAPP